MCIIGIEASLRSSVIQILMHPIGMIKGHPASYRIYIGLRQIQ